MRCEHGVPDYGFCKKCCQRLSTTISKSHSKEIVAQFHIRNGKLNDDGSMGEIKITPRDFLELLGCKDKEIERLNALLNPRLWDQDMHKAWHENIPDVQAAFNALKECGR